MIFDVASISMNILAALVETRDKYIIIIIGNVWGAFTKLRSRRRVGVRERGGAW